MGRNNETINLNKLIEINGYSIYDQELQDTFLFKDEKEEQKYKSLQTMLKDLG